jgi:hypothetical protein
LLLDVGSGDEQTFSIHNVSTTVRSFDKKTRHLRWEQRQEAAELQPLPESRRTYPASRLTA